MPSNACTWVINTYNNSSLLQLVIEQIDSENQGLDLDQKYLCNNSTLIHKCIKNTVLKKTSGYFG